jgi:hypothetical protein
LLVAAAAAWAAGGCGPNALPGSRIATTRVLGARVEAAGDPTRTDPRPGETATVTWLVVEPAGVRPLAWSFLAVPCPRGDEAARCLVEQPRLPVDAPSGAGEGATPPVLALNVPPLDGPGEGDVDRVVVGGVVCAGGAVADPEGAPWSRCAGTPHDGGASVDETDLQLAVALEIGDAGNAPPTLGDDPITWNGTPWGAGTDDALITPADQPCATAPDAPAATAGGPETPVVVGADAGDREPGESLQLSVFSTRGTFDTQFAGVAAGDQRPTTTMTLSYTPPKEGDVDYPAAFVAGAAPDGVTVRFFFVLRDLRGGIDWQARTLCLLPPAINPPAP